MTRSRPIGVRLHLALAATALAVACVFLAGQLTQRMVEDQLNGFTREAATASAKRVAARAGSHYERAGGWVRADIERQLRAQRRLHQATVIRDTNARPVPGSPPRVPANASSATIRAGGRAVGTVFVAPEDGGLSVTTGGRRVSLETALGEHVRTPLLEAGLLAALLAAVGGIVLALRVARPLTGLTEAAERLTRGELDTKLDVGGFRETRLLAGTLDRLRTELRHQEESRRSTVADIAHELRNAMVGIVGRVEAIQDGLFADHDRALEAVKADGRRAGRLIDDIQRLTDAQSSSLLLCKEPLDLGVFVEERLASFGPRFAEQGIALERQLAPAVVQADPTRLAQMVDNLLSNALRYTDSGGLVTVRVCRNGTEAFLEVADTGIGIEPDDLDCVFDRFVRLEGARDRVAEGTGVGLAIVQELATSHGGRVEVSSVHRLGSTFRVALPAVPTTAADVALDREGGDGASPDEPAIWRVCGDIDMATADAAGAHLLEALPAHAPHVVLDLAEVGFMDSAGVHLLVSVQREVRSRGGALAIVAGEAPQVRRLLEVIARREALPVVPTRAAAFQRVQQDGAPTGRR